MDRDFCINQMAVDMRESSKIMNSMDEEYFIN